MLFKIFVHKDVVCILYKYKKKLQKENLNSKYYNIGTMVFSMVNMVTLNAAIMTLNDIINVKNFLFWSHED